LRGYTYSRKKQYDQAVSDLNEIIKLDPNNALAYISRGDIYCIKDQFDKAIDDYMKAIKLDPDYAEGYKNRGKVHEQLGQEKKAIKDFKKALNLNPDNESTKQMLEAIETPMDDFDLDDDEKNDYTHQHVFHVFFYNEAIRIDPNDAKAYFSRGCSYMFSDEYNKAIDDLTEAIRLDPDYARVYFVRGNTYLSVGQHEQAIDDFTEVIKLGLNSYNDIKFSEKNNLPASWLVRNVYSFRGAIYKLIDQYDKAISDFTEIIRLNPDSYHAYVDRGEIYKKMGQMDQAIQDFGNTLSLSPDEGLSKDLIKELIREIQENSIGTSELLKRWGRFL